jgi:hypothetical protein
VDVCVGIYTFRCICMYACVCWGWPCRICSPVVWMFVCVYTHIYVCMYACVRMHVYVGNGLAAFVVLLCGCLCVYIHMYVCMYACVHIRNPVTWMYVWVNVCVQMHVYVDYK